MKAVGSLCLSSPLTPIVTLDDKRVFFQYRLGKKRFKYELNWDKLILNYRNVQFLFRDVVLVEAVKEEVC